MENKKLISAVAALAVVANLGLAGLAGASSQTAQAAVTGGSLTSTASSSTWDLGSTEVALTDATLSASTNFKISDLRGADAGFSSILEFSGNFSDGTHTITLNRVSLDMDAAANGLSSDTDGDDTTGVSTGGDIGTSTLNATYDVTFITGTAVDRVGEYTEDIEMSLVVPKAQEAGTYSTTVTLTAS